MTSSLDEAGSISLLLTKTHVFLQMPFSFQGHDKPFEQFLNTACVLSITIACVTSFLDHERVIAVFFVAIKGKQFNFITYECCLSHRAIKKHRHTVFILQCLRKKSNVYQSMFVWGSLDFITTQIVSYFEFYSFFDVKVSALKPSTFQCRQKNKDV